MRGSIRKRGRTHTAYWSSSDPSTGKRKQHSKGGFATRGAAESHLNSVLGDIEAGEWSPDSKASIKEFAETAWLPAISGEVLAGSIKPTTARFYEDIVGRHIIPEIGSLKIGDLTAVHLNGLYTGLLTTGRQKGGGLSPTTVRRVHVTIHRMLGDAMKWGAIQKNVADQASSPRASSPKRAPWSPAETRAFIEETSESRLGPMWRLLAMTGLRRGEVLGLKWDDIDLNHSRLTVERARVMAAGKVVISSPKTKSASRSIGLDPQTVVALRTYKARQGRERLIAGDAWLGTDWVFTDELGRALHPTKVSKLFAEAAQATHLPKITLHDVRHGYATAALEAGVPIKAVSERLGHKSVAITADIYSHVRPEVDQAYAEHVAAMVMASGSEASTSNTGGPTDGVDKPLTLGPTPIKRKPRKTR
jgi:integrase